MSNIIKKCDVIIPVYNAAQWVKLCVYALFNNTEENLLNKIILLDDGSDELTKDLLNNLKLKYKKIEVVTNKKNLGFVKNCNLGLSKSNADYMLLLNTDCLVSKNTIKKLINHIEKNPKIGLVCPVANNSANISLEMFDGFSYTQMDSLLENKFLGVSFDACTIVGNCLLISRECYDKTGKLDEIFGTGYGEETDYQFRAMKLGFEAKVAIDTYVYHKSEVSFGTSEEKQKKLQRNRKIFFDRHGEEYDKLLKVYEKNDPIEYIKKNVFEEDLKITIDNIMYLPTIVQNAGGVHIVVDLINHLIIRGESINLLYDNILNYNEIMLFNPINKKDYLKFDFKNIVSTIHSSIYMAKKIADEKNIPLLYFVQGYENYFENGAIYGSVELTYKLADHILCISDYLAKEIYSNFNKKSVIINNGINTRLLNKRNNNSSSPKSIAVVLRGNVMKGDWLLLDILKKISLLNKKLIFNIVYMNEYIEFPKFSDNVELNKYIGPLSRESVFNILKKSDIYIDASLNEGFGLTPLEAMSAGCVSVVSNSFGINSYLENNINGFIINEVNDSNKYVDKVMELINNKELYVKLKKEALITANKFEYEDVVEKYIEYFNIEKVKTTLDVKLSNEELRIIEYNQKLTESNNIYNGKVSKISKMLPKPIKNKIKKIITKLYGMYHH